VYATCKQTINVSVYFAIRPNITFWSGLVDLSESGHNVIADKGFTIKNLLEAKDVGLNIPPFLGDERWFSLAEDCIMLM